MRSMRGRILSLAPASEAVIALFITTPPSGGTFVMSDRKSLQSAAVFGSFFTGGGACSGSLVAAAFAASTFTGAVAAGAADTVPIGSAGGIPLVHAANAERPRTKPTKRALAVAQGRIGGA